MYMYMTLYIIYSLQDEAQREDLRTSCSIWYVYFEGGGYWRAVVGVLGVYYLLENIIHYYYCQSEGGGRQQSRGGTFPPPPPRKYPAVIVSSKF